MGRKVHLCEVSPGFQSRYALVHVSSGAKVYLKRGPLNRLLIERYAYRHLSYVGSYWPGRELQGFWARVGPNPPPGDPEAFAREVERARADDPDLEHLP